MAVHYGTVRFVHKGNFNNTLKFLNRRRRENLIKKLNDLGKRGCAALAAATPKDTGKTSESWYYKITEEGNHFNLDFLNSNLNDNVNVALLIQYGHAIKVHVAGPSTRDGKPGKKQRKVVGYVQGRDYINPALQPLFDEISNDAWEEVIYK